MITPELHERWLEVSGQVSQADRLFKELGYKIAEYNSDEIFGYYNEDAEHIDFYLEDREVEKYSKIMSPAIPKSFSMQELKAINKKCEEFRMEG